MAHTKKKKKKEKKKKKKSHGLGEELRDGAQLKLGSVLPCSGIRFAFLLWTQGKNRPISQHRRRKVVLKRNDD